MPRPERGPTGFYPFTSGPTSLGVLPTFREIYLRNAPGRTIGAEETLTSFFRPDGYDEYTALANNQVRMILRATYPAPMPVTLVLQVRSSNEPFSRASFYPAVTRGFPDDVEFTQLAQQSGRFLVEWGVGEARSQLHLDLASASLQLPACTHINVRACVFNLREGQSAVAGAIALPGVHAGGGGRATFTKSVYATADAEFDNVERQPYATHAFAVVAGGRSTAGDDVDDASVRISGVAQSTVVGQVFYASPQEPPVEVPLTPLVDRFDIRLTASTAPSATSTYTVASLVQVIRVV